MGKRNIHILSILLVVALAISAARAVETVVNESAENTIPELDCVIEPSEIVDVGSAVPGVVESILADRSDLVKRGTVLAELESSVERAALDLAKARAQLNTAVELRQENATFVYLTQKRNQSLLQTSAISMQDMDQLKTETRIAELQVKQEQDNQLIAGLEYLRAQAVVHQRRIHSPVDGVVMDRFKSVGEYVEDEPMLRVAQLDPLYVEVIVPVEYLGRVTPGMQAEVSAVVPNSATHLATVERVDRVADAASGTYGVRLSLSNPDYEIPAGLRCRLGFLPQEQEQQDDEIAVKSDATEIEPLDTELISESLMLESEDSAVACYNIGPLSDNDLVQQLSDQLETQSQGVALRQESISQADRYLVVADSKPDQHAIQAIQARLQSAGISDTYVMLGGDYQGRLSLGLYSKQETAHNRQQQLAAKGFDTEILPISKTVTEYWLDISLKAENKLQEQIQEISAKLPPTASIEPAACHHLVANR